MVSGVSHLGSFDLAGALAQLGSALDHAWRVAPGLVVACGIALIIPTLAVQALVLGVVLRRLLRLAARRTVRPSPEAAITLGKAWVRPDGAPPIELPSSRTLMVVGRDQDADLVLDDQTVAGHHAAIERTPDDEYWIIDLTGPTGPGVSVDNHRVARRRLVGGERIVLGSRRLTFESRLR